jgi:hypothetical protein
MTPTETGEAMHRIIRFGGRLRLEPQAGEHPARISAAAEPI